MLTKQFDFRLKELSDSGTFEGFASTYGNIDHAGDIVMPGAFSKSISDQPSVPILYQHDTKQPIGLGLLEDTESGLKMYGELVLDVPEAKSAYALMKKGVLKGLSIGYTVAKETFDKAKSANLLEQIDLMEVSLVTFPCNIRATVVAVKAADAVSTIRDFEDLLRDAGFSRKQATALASGGFKALQRDADNTDEDAAAFIAALQQFKSHLKENTWN